jgi:hypothetical protein
MPLWRRLLPIQVPALLPSSPLWPASPLPPSASMATGSSIPIPVIADGNRSERSPTVARPAGVLARPSGSTNLPTPTPSRAPPTPSASASGVPALPAPGSVPTSLGSPARRPLATQGDLKTLSINTLNQNPAPLRYKIPPFPIPLSSWGLSPSTSALRCKKTSAPSSIFWHATALCLLLLLLTVADSRSLSLYPDASLSRILRLDPLAVVQRQPLFPTDDN